MFFATKMTGFIVAVFIAALLILFYSLWIERYIIVTPTYTLHFENLPEEFDGYKIALFSDVHQGKFMPGFWIGHVIKKINNLDVDVIAGVGDFVHKRNTHEELETVWPYLRKLQAKDGVYLVNGNHDHWADHSLSLKYLEESNYSIRHRHKIITRGREKIVIGGAGEFWEDELGIDKAYKGIDNDLFKILLVHNPDVADINHSNRIDLYLSGHTHGGQVFIPFVNYAPILPVKNKIYDQGHIKNRRGESVFITRGVGWAVLPIRFNCFPEISIIELRKKVN